MVSKGPSGATVDLAHVNNTSYSHGHFVAIHICEFFEGLALFIFLSLKEQYLTHRGYSVNVQ